MAGRLRCSTFIDNGNLKSWIKFSLLDSNANNQENCRRNPSWTSYFAFLSVVAGRYHAYTFVRRAEVGHRNSIGATYLLEIS